MDVHAFWRLQSRVLTGFRGQDADEINAVQKDNVNLHFMYLECVTQISLNDIVISPKINPWVFLLL